jgi:hypothetical protein
MLESRVAATNSFILQILRALSSVRADVFENRDIQAAFNRINGISSMKFSFIKLIMSVTDERVVKTKNGERENPAVYRAARIDD